ncbi:unnamed protein product [Phytophthora fragariaefolia]|uniref:RxLR effector protein n=1 Tax=Phytophthora fragariaefolia TaxID=1490495 RepID=A0A9W7CYA6_9STRA|nr:unnamed protein product [Phytophthora fragariaefolia]
MMRALYFLIIVTAIFFANINAGTASSTAGLVSPDTVPVIDNVHEASAGKRLLRSHRIAEEVGEDSEDDTDKIDSEERGIKRGAIDDAVENFVKYFKASTGTGTSHYRVTLESNPLLDRNVLDAALVDKTQLRQLFQKMGEAPDGVWYAAIKKIYDDEAYQKYIPVLESMARLFD